MAQHDYELIVIGSGPAGQKAAIQAAKLEKKVAIVERKSVVGGVCINSGTIPSKTLREAVIYLSGYRQHNIYGEAYQVKDKITVTDLSRRTEHVMRNEIDVTLHQLSRNGIDVINAEASFVDSHTLNLKIVDSDQVQEVSGENIFIATGTSATRDPHIPFDGRNIMTSDDILYMDEIPRTLTVVGAGVIGIEYASIFAALDVRVTLIDRRDEMLSFVDREIIDDLVYHLRQNDVIIHTGENVSGVEMMEDDHESVKIHLESGKIIQSEKVLYSIGRTGASAALNLEAAGLNADKRGRLKVNENFQTDVPNIYAIGDIIGFPSLASTSMEQGRMAACHAFGEETHSIPALFPYGIYSIPEISTVGKNEEELTAAGIPYEIGKAQYREVARGHIIGDSVGMLKLIFHLETREVLGVHIIGERASELVHIGQTVMAFGGKIDYFVDTVFNYPTLAECYKIAALNGVNRLAK